MRSQHPAAPVTLGVSLKLYLDNAATLAWSTRVADIARAHPAVTAGRVRLFVMPSLPAVPAVLSVLDGTGVRVGAQNLDVVDRGAYTGAVSGTDLRDLGCDLVEVGHAERRQHFGEDEATGRAKFAAAVRNDLVPVLCLGEAAEGASDVAAAECIRQLDAALGSTDASGLEVVLAYEPVWAIGQAQPAPFSHVNRVAEELRTAADADPRLGRVTIIYGGSAQLGTLSNLGEAVDGLFLGRFAHDADDLRRMIDEADARGSVN